MGELDATQHQLDISYRAGDMVTVRRLLDDMRRPSAVVGHPEVRQTLAYNEMRFAVYDGNWIAVLQLARSRRLRSKPGPTRR